MEEKKIPDSFSGEYDQMKPVEFSKGSLSEEERLKQMAAPLLSWFRENRRDLPWRREPTPYHVWLSEIMLQQTRVEAVIPYYHRFLEEVPDIPALAEVSEEKLMKLWQGLGYYNRAKNMREAAKETVQTYGGELPADYEQLLKLPGIGAYTAGAIASIAFGIARPAVDGNVLRVIARLLASTEYITLAKTKKKTEQALQSVLPSGQAGDFNQALMELGALVCVPNGEPHCGECPLAGICLAHQQKKTDQIPCKAPKKPRRVEERTILVIRAGNTYAICKRPPKGLLANLYEFPNLEGKLSGERLMEYMHKAGEMEFSAKALPPESHVFSHVEWKMSAYLITLKHKRSDSFHFVPWAEILHRYAIPSAYKPYLELMETEEKRRLRRLTFS